MATMTGRDSVAREICEALGLKHVRKFNMHMALDELVTISVEMYPEKEDLKRLISIFREYELVEKKKEESSKQEV